MRSPAGTVKLSSLSLPKTTLARRSSCGGSPTDAGPHLKCTPPRSSMFSGGDEVAMKKEKVVDLVVGGEETPRLSRRLEPLHLSFLPSRRLVRILRSVV